MTPQQMVEQFYAKYGHAINQPHDERMLALRRELLREEYQETSEALLYLQLYETEVRTGAQSSNPEQRQALLVDVVDGLCDLIYVAYGTAVSLGIDLQPHLEEVHRSNMIKAMVRVEPGEKYGAGGGKGPDFSSADHARLLS